jgi:hypothetical protein
MSRKGLRRSYIQRKNIGKSLNTTAYVHYSQILQFLSQSMAHPIKHPNKVSGVQVDKSFRQMWYATETPRLLFST